MAGQIDDSGAGGPTPGGPVRPGGRWLRVALVMSLALNLAVAGVLAGAWLRHAGPERWEPRDPGRHTSAPARDRDPGIGPWGRALSATDRAALRDAFEGERGRLLEGVRADRADRAALAAVLRADPLDVAAMDAITDRMQARADDRLAVGQRLVRAHVIALPAAERAALADRLEASLTRRRPRD